MLAGLTAEERSISPAECFPFQCAITLTSKEHFLKEGKRNAELIGESRCTPIPALHLGSSTGNTVGNGFVSQGDAVSLGRSATWGGTEGMLCTGSAGTQPGKLLVLGKEQKEATLVCFTGGSQQTQDQTQEFN